jgi:hypothetical protein
MGTREVTSYAVMTYTPEALALATMIYFGHLMLYFCVVFLSYFMTWLVKRLLSIELLFSLINNWLFPSAPSFGPTGTLTATW